MKIPETMKAAVLMAPNRLEVKEVQTPKPGPVDVLIKVEACAVCSTDVSLIDHPLPGQPPYGSFIPGHEYSGTVVALGDTVDEFQVGDRVTVEAHLIFRRAFYDLMQQKGWDVPDIQMEQASVEVPISG